MSKEEAFQWYYQGCKDTDYIDERTARTYFEQSWEKRNASPKGFSVDLWIDDGRVAE